MIDIDYLEKIASLKSIRHLKDVASLNLSPDDYYIGASANMRLFGYPVPNEDIDINMTRAGYNKIKDRLVPMKADGIHNGHYTNSSGTLDIAIDTSKDPLSLKNQLSNTVVVDNYRFLNKEGLKNFYKTIYNKLGKEKHKQRLEWLNTH